MWHKRFTLLRALTPSIATMLVLVGTTTVEARRFPKHGRLLIAYDLAPGASSDPIELPSGQAVQVSGVQTTIGNRGVGQVTMLHPTEAPFFLEWTGIESPAGATITSGFSSSPGTHVVYLDFSHTVDIEVQDADHFRIHNSNGAPQSGNVTLLW